MNKKYKTILECVQESSQKNEEGKSAYKFEISIVTESILYPNSVDNAIDAFKKELFKTLDKYKTVVGIKRI